MKKYEAVVILNPNLSSKADDFIKDFEKLLIANSFRVLKCEDVGRRQLSYSINNHNKGHYLLFDIEGEAPKLIEIENKIKYNESIIRHLFLSVKNHSGQDSQLFIDSKNKKHDSEEIINKEDKKKVERVKLKEDSDNEDKKNVDKKEKVDTKDNEPKSSEANIEDKDVKDE